MQRESYQDRRATGPVGDLVAHLDWKLEELPRLAKEFRLKEATVADLRQHLLDERDQLLTLPQDMDVREAMEHHFAEGAYFREKVTGKKDGEQQRVFGPTFKGRVRNFIKTITGKK